MPQQATSQDLIRALLAEGWSQRAIANALGRDSRLISFVLSGQKPGRNLLPALEELSQTGQVTTPPSRRRARDGQPVKVRGRGGALVTPPRAQRRRTAPPPRPTRRRARRDPDQTPPSTAVGRQPEFGDAPTPGSGPNRFQVSSHTTEGSTKEHHEVTVPRSDRSWNRWEGSEFLREVLKRARDNGRRFHAFVTVEVGPPGQRQRRNVKLGGRGGYDPSNALVGISNDGLIWDWLRNQVEGRYADLDSDSDWTVVGLDLDVW